MPCASRTTNTATSYIRCPVLTNHCGKSTARVLQQLHYWLSHENLSYGIIHNNRQWIRNSYNQWHQQIKKTNQDLAIITIRRAFSDLEKQGIVLSHCFDDHKNYMGGNQVKSYTIDYDRLESIVGDLNKTLISRPRSVQEQQSTSTPQVHNRAGDTSFLSIVPIHTDARNVGKKRASNPDQMSTPPDQMSTPLNRYISNKHSNKLYLFRATHSIEQTQQRVSDAETIQPGKPAEKNEIDFSKEMIEFWNEIVEENSPQRKISLNPKRSQNLNSALKQFFENDLVKWEMFCHKITTCKFLMGEITRFKAPIDWTIRPETIQKIQEGGYTFGTREATYKLKLSQIISGAGETLKTSLSAFTPSMQESETAIAIRESIKRKVDNAQYMSWFSPTEIVIEINENGHQEATLCVPTRFMGERIKTTYSDIYERYFTTYFVGSAEQHLKSRNSHNSVSHPQKIYISNEYQEQKIADLVKDISPINLHNEPGTSALTFPKENRQIERTAVDVHEKSFSIKKCTLSSNSFMDVDLKNAETSRYIVEHEESNPSKNDLLKTSGVTPDLIQVITCGDDICLVNDDITAQQEISQTRTDPICDRKDLALGHTIKREQPNSVLIRKDSEACREKPRDFSHNASVQISVKPYSSTLNDLKIIKIRKKIKNLIPEDLYMQWFHTTTIVIEEGRVFLHVPTYSIKHSLETQFQCIVREFFEAVRVVEEQSPCAGTSFPLEENEIKENIRKPLNMPSSLQSDVNERKDLARQHNAGVSEEGYGSVPQHRSEELPDKLYVCKKGQDSAFDQLRVIYDNAHSFLKKLRCRDPVMEGLSIQKCNKAENVEHFDTSLFKLWLVNDNDPPNVKKESVYTHKKRSLTHFFRKRICLRLERIIKPIKHMDLHHGQGELSLFKEYSAHRIRDEYKFLPGFHGIC